jgi:GntR family transcriptional regulator, phosphonate transport system regulatory protein
MRRTTERESSSAHGVTLWRRIADDFEQAIFAGTYSNGDRLPGEIEIAERLGVNRHTVRRALAELTERGLVRAERGSGTYVKTTRLTYPIGSRTRFSEIVGGAGLEVGGRLIAHATEPASAAIAKQFGLRAGELIVRMEVLRSANRVPICLATVRLPAERMPDVARVYRKHRSMTRTLSHFGIRDYRRQRTRICATHADAVDAQYLGMAAGRPLLLVDSVDVTPLGEVILTSNARFAADRVELTVES